MRIARDSCWASVNIEQAELVERHHAEAFLAERVVPGAEVHNDRDLTWVVHAGQAWRNDGIMVRFSGSAAARRLDTVVERYHRHGRGMALWISPVATPGNVTELLAARRLRCRSYFPAMVRRLSNRVPRLNRPKLLEVRPVRDLEDFGRIAHPAIGPLTTVLRHRAFARLSALVSEPSGRTRNYVAWLDQEPVGSIEMFLGSECAGIHGLSVLDQHQRRGIGSALLEHACHEARRNG